MENSTTPLFSELNLLFKSKIIFESKISFQELNEYNKKHFIDEKEKSKYNDEQFKIIKLCLLSNQFEGKVLQLLESIENGINEKLDTLGENKIKCTYFIEKNNKLKDIFDKIIALKNGYNLNEIDNLKVSLPIKEGVIVEFSSTDIYLLILNDSLDEIKKLSKNLYENHRNLFNGDDYVKQMNEYGLPFISEKEPIKKGKPGEKIKRTKTDLVLEDIWQCDSDGTKKSYAVIIKLLLTEYNEIQSSFISGADGKYEWNKQPKKGWVQYMAGFIYTCLEKKWIKDDWSSDQYKEIFCRTFNINSFDSKPFDSIKANPPNDKYLKPFKSITENK